VPRTAPMGGAGGPSNTVRTVRGQYTGKK
jgi:hypothetical protein